MQHTLEHFQTKALLKPPDPERVNAGSAQTETFPLSTQSRPDFLCSTF